MIGIDVFKDCDMSIPRTCVSTHLTQMYTHIHTLTHKTYHTYMN